VKHIVFLEARGPAAQLHACLLAGVPSRMRGITALAVNLVQGADPGTPWHAVLELWGDQTLAQSPWEDAEIDRRVARRAVYRVTELVEKDVGPARRWPTAGPKLIVPWIGRRELTPAEQRRHWDEHVPLANRIHVGCTRYVRNWVEASAPNLAATTPPYQGIAIQHFLTEQDLRERSFDSPASVQVIQDDVAEFIAEYMALQTVEYFSVTERAT
jgi:EthD domain